MKTDNWTSLYLLAAGKTAKVVDVTETVRHVTGPVELYVVFLEMCTDNVYRIEKEYGRVKAEVSAVENKLIIRGAVQADNVTINGFAITAKSGNVEYIIWKKCESHTPTVGHIAFEVINEDI